MAYGMGGIVPFPKPNNSADAKLQMGKLLKRVCPYCGAAVGQPCRSRTGLILTSNGGPIFVRWVDIQREDASCDTDHSRLTCIPFMIARLPERPAGALSLCRYWVGSCRFLNQTIRATRSYKWESFSGALANTVGPLSASHAEAEPGSF